MACENAAEVITHSDSSHSGQATSVYSGSFLEVLHSLKPVKSPVLSRYEMHVNGSTPASEGVDFFDSVLI